MQPAPLEDINRGDVKGEISLSHFLASIETTIDYDNDYAEVYLKSRNYYKDLAFVRLDTLEEDATFPMMAGNGVSDVFGVTINDNEYAIHLLDCYKEKEACAFRVNGVPTGWIGKENTAQVPRKQRSFKLNDDYQLVIKSIQFNYCDNRRFCDYFYESYDLVELSIERDKKSWWQIW